MSIVAGNCTAGFFIQSDNQGVETCALCPLDQYNPQLYQQSCTPCPNGTGTRLTGADNIALCEGKSYTISATQPINFFPMHHTLWDDMKFFPFCCISHCWMASTTSFLDMTLTQKNLLQNC